MDWSEQINRFVPLSQEGMSSFASPREMDQAIGIYNKALFNLHHDSQDIAVIALRKLVATYPDFAPPFFLYACCLAERDSEKKEIALELIGQAIQIGLPEDLQQEALYCQFDLRDDLKRQAAAAAPVSAHHAAGPAAALLRPAAGAARTRSANALSGNRKAEANRKIPVQAAGVLERVHRSGKVRMASERERQGVIHRGDFPQNEETHVVSRREPAEILRAALPVLAGILIVATLVLAAVRWLPGIGLFAGKGNREPSASEQLDWLLNRLETLKGNDLAIASLMDEYRTKYQPLPTTAAATPSPTEPKATTTAATAPAMTTAAQTTAITLSPTTKPTASGLTTPEPTFDSSSAVLLDAFASYEQAQAVQSSDLTAAADQLLNARALLAIIPAATTAEGYDENADALSQKVEYLIKGIAVNAAREFRLLGNAEFDKKRYEAALVPYLKAWQLYPGSYGGGVAYYCGRCYQLLGDYESARPFYDYVVETFSGRDIAGSAAGRLAEMGY